MSPPREDRSRPGRGGNGDDIQSIHSVDDAHAAVRDLELGWSVGYGHGYDIGRAHGRAEEGDAWQAIITGWAETTRRPNYAEIEARRVPDWRPCRQRCRACSRCIASLAYYGRGGRPYEGVERERELAGAVS
jgi:hypothetical protein